MKVNDVTLGTQRSDMLRKRGLEATERVGKDTSAKESSESKGAVQADRVEISKAAREVSKEQKEVKREIEFARRAMYSIPPMSEERAQELLKRLERGEYNAPDVRMNLSERLTGDLVPDAPEAGGKAESA
jgi:hypothetical protein